MRETNKNKKMLENKRKQFLIRNRKKRKQFLIRNRKKRKQFLIRNRKGWIKVVEAFVGILLIGGVLLIIINQNSETSNDVSSKVYRNELTMLRAVQLNDSLRASILNLNDNGLPLSLNDSGFPPDVKAKINEKNPGYLTCDAKICKINQNCAFNNTAPANIYTNQVVIFANFQKYNPRKLVISCVLED